MPHMRSASSNGWRGPTRRAFLRGAAALLTALALPWRAVAGEPARVLRLPARLEPGRAGWISPPQAARHPFTAVGALWPSGAPPAGAVLEARASADGVRWTPWQPLPLDPDGPAAPHGMLLFVPPSQVVQCRLAVPGPAPELVLLDTAAGPEAPRAEGAVRLLGARAPAGRLAPPRVVSRAGWGADETRRWWAPDYHVADHVALHHTGGATGGADPAAAVRAVYYYHTVVLDWGDIGYHFLVDWLGTIYEGRYGGPHVVGGHLRGRNPLVEGIAALGHYDATWPSDDLLAALAALLAWRAEVLALDPLATAPLGERPVPTLLGHRDAAPTDCPGRRLYASLGTLRRQAADLLGYVPQLAAELLAVAPGLTTILAGEPLPVLVRLRNQGTLPLQPAAGAARPAADPLGPLEGTRGPLPPPGAVVVALGTAEEWRAAQQPPALGAAPDEDAGDYGPDAPRATPAPPLAHPYRWSLPLAVAPGASATVGVHLRLRHSGPRQLVAAIVRQDGATLAEWPAGAAVEVVPAPAAVRPALPPRFGPLVAPAPPLAAGRTTVLGLASAATSPAAARWQLGAASDDALPLPPGGSARQAIAAMASDSVVAAHPLRALVVEGAVPLAGGVWWRGAGAAATGVSLLGPRAGPLALPLLPPLVDNAERWLWVYSADAQPVVLRVEWGPSAAGDDARQVPLGPRALVQLPVPTVAPWVQIAAEPAVPLAAVLVEEAPGGTLLWPLAAAEHALLVPAVGTAEGWAAEVTVANLGAGPLAIEVRWTGYGEPPGWTERAVLPAGGVARWPAGRASWPFGRWGSLAVTAAEPALAVAGRLVREGDGTALALPATPPASGALLVPLAELPGLPEQRRLGLHAGPQGAAVTLRYRDVAGREVARAPEVLAAGAARALALPEAAGEAAAVEVAVESGVVAAALLQGLLASP